ncbi:MAG: PilZ domain-containing protein [Myxococcota bacterium]|jgi:hypothetical protein|nr:PilZ domain-containing protein [Myxococcota bacterium]
MYKRGELRRGIRLPIEVILGSWDDPVMLKASDFSPAGAYIESDFLPDAGESLICSFGLRRMDEYCVFASVARVNPFRRRADTGAAGFGVCFSDLKPLERLRIRQMLRGLPPPLPKPAREEDPIHVGWLC